MDVHATGRGKQDDRGRGTTCGTHVQSAGRGCEEGEREVRPRHRRYAAVPLLQRLRHLARWETPERRTASVCCPHRVSRPALQGHTPGRPSEHLRWSGWASHVTGEGHKVRRKMHSIQKSARCTAHVTQGRRRAAGSAACAVGQRVGRAAGPRLCGLAALCGRAAPGLEGLGGGAGPGGAAPQRRHGGRLRRSVGPGAGAALQGTRSTAPKCPHPPPTQCL